MSCAGHPAGLRPTSRPASQQTRPAGFPAPDAEHKRIRLGIWRQPTQHGSMPPPGTWHLPSQSHTPMAFPADTGFPGHHCLLPLQHCGLEQQTGQGPAPRAGAEAGGPAQRSSPSPSLSCCRHPSHCLPPTHPPNLPMVPTPAFSLVPSKWVPTPRSAVNMQVVLRVSGLQKLWASEVEQGLGVQEFVAGHCTDVYRRAQTKPQTRKELVLGNQRKTLEW